MKKKHALSPEEKLLFREAVPGIKRLQNDTITHRPVRKKVTEVSPKKLLQEQVDATYYFSDEFQPMLQEEGPVGRPHVLVVVDHQDAESLGRRLGGGLHVDQPNAAGSPAGSSSSPDWRYTSRSTRSAGSPDAASSQNRLPDATCAWKSAISSS